MATLASINSISKPFATLETTETRSFLAEELAACSSDIDLMELAIKVRRSPGGESKMWLDEVIAQGLQSASAYGQARAVDLRFLDWEISRRRQSGDLYLTFTPCSCNLGFILNRSHSALLT
jgi:hypothetical protein